VDGCSTETKTVTKHSGKLYDAKLKAFVDCKKKGLKDGSVDGAAALAACLGADPKGKIARKLEKLVAGVLGKCGAVSQPLAFPGECAAAGDLSDCVDRLVECRACLQVQAMDGLTGELDCDLFDDGGANGSCGPPFPLAAGTGGDRQVAPILDPGPISVEGTVTRCVP
jgi:hypothetical protein